MAKKSKSSDKIKTAIDNGIGFHIKYMIKRRYRTKEAFIQSTGISYAHIENMLRGRLDLVPYTAAIKLCETLDLNPFDFMPDINFELNRFKTNKVMTLFTTLNNYGRRKILEQMADYAQLPKYVDRITPLNDLVEPDDHIINPMPVDTPTIDLINAEAKLAAIPLQELPHMSEALKQTFAEGKNLKIGTIKSGGVRKEKRERIAKIQEELKDFNEYYNNIQEKQEEL